VKENQEKDKIGSKPDKNGKRVKVGKSLKQLQWIKEEKPEKTQKEWSKRIHEIDLFLTPDDPIPPSIEDDDDSEGDILFLERLLHDDPIPLPDTLDVDFSNVVRVFLPFFTYPVTSHVLLSSTLAKGFYPPSLNFLSFNWESCILILSTNVLSYGPPNKWP
nr:hypothetical protein [Tanacetum cinerariifolium]